MQNYKKKLKKSKKQVVKLKKLVELKEVDAKDGWNLYKLASDKVESKQAEKEEIAKALWGVQLQFLNIFRLKFSEFKFDLGGVK